MVLKIESEEQSKLDELEQWKKEASIVIDNWTNIWRELGRPGKIGDDISVASLEEVKRIKAQLSNFWSSAAKLESFPYVYSYSINATTDGIEATINLYSKNFNDISKFIEKLTQNEN